MSALAMFSLKDPSLLAFDERRNEDNLPATPGEGCFGEGLLVTEAGEEVRGGKMGNAGRFGSLVSGRSSLGETP
jgi:hypothetical protein